MAKAALDIAKYIDHTLLKPNATKEDIVKLCKEAIEHKFKGVCVNSFYIPLIAELLEGEEPIPISVVGFPFGATLSSSKAFEAKEAVSAGAEEIDMVINIGALKEKQYNLVYDDICAVVSECKPCPVKVIIETCFLEKDEKIIACALAKVAGASFIKTSTGFGEGGAKIEDIALIRSIVGDNMQIKASGGIRTYQDALKMIEAGAKRIGSSNSVNIVLGKEEAKALSPKS